MDLRSYLRDYEPKEDQSGGTAPWEVETLTELDGLGPANVPEEMFFSLQYIGPLYGLLEHAPVDSRKTRGPFWYHVWETFGDPESPESTRYGDAIVAEVKRRERQVGDVEWFGAEVDSQSNYYEIQFCIYMEAQTLRGAAEEAVRISSEIDKAARAKAG